MDSVLFLTFQRRTTYLFLGIVSMGTVLAATIILPILAFIRTSSAFTTLSTIVGTFIGFISGVYLSIGSVGESLQQVMTWFPLTQVNALLKTDFDERCN